MSMLLWNQFGIIKDFIRNDSVLIPCLKQEN